MTRGMESFFRHCALCVTAHAARCVPHRYLVQEVVGGGDLFSILIKRQSAADAAGLECPFTEAAVAKIVVQIVSAIAHCHARGVMHRDLKPENILCLADDESQLKLCDFGLACAHTVCIESLSRDSRFLRSRPHPSSYRSTCRCCPATAGASSSRTGSSSSKQDLSSTLRQKFSHMAWGTALRPMSGALVSSHTCPAPSNAYATCVCGVCMCILQMHHMEQVLLCGRLPFRGASPKEAVEAVLRMPLEFPSPEWDLISLETKTMIAEMMLNRELSRAAIIVDFSAHVPVRV